MKKNKKAWISTDILDMMEKRKRAKNTQDYDEINRQVKRACKIAKENWLEEQCQEIENLEKQHLTRQMHEKIRRVTNRRKTTQTTGVMDKQDNMCFEKEALVNVWTEYIGELYADDRVTRPEINDESRRCRYHKFRLSSKHLSLSGWRTYIICYIVTYLISNCDL